jgi:hypothetical protein
LTANLPRSARRRKDPLVSARDTRSGPAPREGFRTGTAHLTGGLVLFDPHIWAIVRVLGRVEQASSARAQTEMGMRFISPERALRAAGDWLVRHSAV